MRLPSDQILAAADSSRWTSSGCVPSECAAKLDTEWATDPARDRTLLTSEVHSMCVASSVNWAERNFLNASLKQAFG